MKKRIFEGAATALVTPFSGGLVDYLAFGGIIEHQIECGVSALVVCGTTGEAATLDASEREEVIRFAVGRAGGRASVIAGCSSSSTSELCRMAERYSLLGVDALLTATPAYNKGTAEGVCAHFRAAAGFGVPVIMYNVPSRTGYDTPFEVYRELAGDELLVGIKEASGDVGKAAALLAEFSGDYAIYSGSDEVNLPILALGGTGVISVVSNVFPGEVSRMCSLAIGGDFAGARVISGRLQPLCRALFSEVNPVPVKAAMEHLGRCGGEVRLPLTRLSASKRERLVEVVERCGELF